MAAPLQERVELVFEVGGVGNEPGFADNRGNIDRIDLALDRRKGP